MANLTKMKLQKPIRIFGEDWQRVKSRLSEDKINFQQLMYSLAMAYVGKNKGIMEIVQKIKKKGDKSKRYALTDEQADDIMNFVESESPFGKDSIVGDAIKELEQEEQNEKK